MDISSVLLSDFNATKYDPVVAESFLTEQLKARDSYDAYFSSMPLPGSVVEDIAEIEAQISAQERKLRNLLVENKQALCDSLCNEQIEPQLSAMLTQIDELWEVEKTEAVKERPSEAQGPHGDFWALLNEPMEEDQQPKDGSDELNAALRKLQLRAVNSTDGDLNNARDNLALVLTHWNSVSELLELPTLTSTCIKTGHYQEALMCHTHARGLVEKFPQITIIRHMADSISREITTTMLQGLVKMLQQNLSANPIKKILSYLSSIPPFDENPQALVQVFLAMRHKFVCSEMNSFEITELTNDTMRELLVKRKIEAFREHVYNALAILQSQPELFNNDNHHHHKFKISMPLLDEPKKPITTNPLMLLFVEQCCDALIRSLAPQKDSLSVSVCLQLVYCSFRLADCNPNYHHLFIRKIQEANLVSATDLSTAMDKRRELANKYY
ncbi:LAFA_0G13498g1_1 [Lachancea sp. 'fantastica']|nr:LAFA_0G13498g1_1 [Lachancea sp. 'fantastica']